MKNIKSINEVMTGGFLILVSLLAFYLASSLSSNTEVGLGPGYVPKMFAVIQFALGVILIGSGFIKSGDAAEPWQLRPMTLILSSIVFFAVSIERLGLVIAVVGLVLISCAANRGTTLKESLALAIGSAAVSAILFVKLLGLSIGLWPLMLLGK